MENKFYTPEIDEFFVGFEYEQKDGFTDGTVKTQEDFDLANWAQLIFSVGDAPYVERALSGKNASNGLCGIRVKFLDRQDIEECGFVQVEYDTYRKEHIYFEFNNEYKTFIYEKEAGLEKTIFAGTIRNKSELKKVMKMVNINPENK